MAHSQNDLRWKSKKVGYGSAPFGGTYGVGCTVTALSNWLNRVFGYNFTPDEVNEKLKTFKGFSDGRTVGKGNLIVWTAIPKAFPKVGSVSRVRNYNNLVVSTYVYVKRLPVLVEVFNRLAPGGKHWVEFLGGRKLCDPLDGKEYSTSKYEAVGYTLINKA